MGEMLHVTAPPWCWCKRRGWITNIGSRCEAYCPGDFSGISDNPDWWRSLPREVNGGKMVGLPLAHHPNTLPTGLGLGLGLRAGEWLWPHPGTRCRMELTGTISTVSCGDMLWHRHGGMGRSGMAQSWLDIHPQLSNGFRGVQKYKNKFVSHAS